MCANRADTVPARDGFCCIVIVRFGKQKKEIICDDVQEVRNLIKEFTDKGADEISLIKFIKDKDK